MELAHIKHGDSPETQVLYSSLNLSDVSMRFCVRETADVIESIRRDAAEWLHDAEWNAWRQMRDTLRRNSFLAGRALAKRALCSLLDKPVSPRKLLITSPAVDRGSKTVHVSCGVDRLPWRLSIAHSNRFVGVVVFLSESVTWGLDLVDVDEVDRSRLSFWMSDEECRYFPGAASAVCWSVKEAAYKTLNDGAPFEPQSIRVNWASRSGEGRYRWTFPNGTTGSARVWSRSPCVIALAELHSRN